MNNLSGFQIRIKLWQEICHEFSNTIIVCTKHQAVSYITNSILLTQQALIWLTTFILNNLDCVGKISCIILHKKAMFSDGSPFNTANNQLSSQLTNGNANSTLSERNSNLWFLSSQITCFYSSSRYHWPKDGDRTFRIPSLTTSFIQLKNSSL